MNAGRRQGIEVSEPIGAGTDLGAKGSSAGEVPKVAVRAVEDAGASSSGQVEIAPIADGIIAFGDAGVGGVVDVEGDCHGGALGDVGAYVYAAHVAVQFIVLLAIVVGAVGVAGPVDPPGVGFRVRTLHYALFVGFVVENSSIHSCLQLNEGVAGQDADPIAV